MDISGLGVVTITAAMLQCMNCLAIAFAFDAIHEIHAVAAFLHVRARGGDMGQRGEGLSAANR
jgi:hypothetical protein